MTILAERVRINKDAGFEQLHPRDQDGQFVRVAGAIAKLIEDFGDIIAHEEIGERDHHFSDHGSISVHDNGDAVISLIDEDGNPVTLADGISPDQLMDVQQEIEDSLTELDRGDLNPGMHLDWNPVDEDAPPSPVQVGYGVMSDGTQYVSLTGPEDRDDVASMQFTREHAGDLLTRIEQIHTTQSQYADDKDNPFIVRPLTPGENLEQRKGFSSESDFDLVAGLVSTPGGHRLRLGIAGTDDYPVKKWTGGRGPMTADLGHDEAVELDYAIQAARTELDDYVETLEAADEALDAWYETPSGQRMAELGAQGQGWGLWTTGEGERVKRFSGAYPNRTEELAPPDVAAEYMALYAEMSTIQADFGLVDEGDVYSWHEVETTSGTIRIEVIGNTLDYNNPAEARITIRPSGVSDEDWYDQVTSHYSSYADYGAKQLAAIRKLVAGYVDAAQQEPITKSAGSATDTPGAGRARALKRYWTRGEGLAKWVRSAHPWTTLRRHLAKYITDPDKLDRTTSAWFHSATGTWPGSRRGKNPVGPG